MDNNNYLGYIKYRIFISSTLYSFFRKILILIKNKINPEII